MNNKDREYANILFQKLGATWYVFTEINDNVIYSPLPDGMDPRSTKLQLFEIIEEHMEKISNFNTPLPSSAA